MYMSKIVDIKSLTPKQKLLFFGICLILLVVITTIALNLNIGYEAIDYKNTDIYSFIIHSEETNDRDIYWTLDNIVSQFIGTYQSEFTKDVKNLDYFYNALDPDYKKYLGKKKYKEISNDIITKVIGEQKDVFSSIPAPLITTVYKLSDYDNAYICKLATQEDSASTYIGIILDTDKNKFNIFYLE